MAVSATGAGASSPAIAWSTTALRISGLGPIAANTVGLATPASAAMSAMEVARYPFVENSRCAAAQISRGASPRRIVDR